MENKENNKIVSYFVDLLFSNKKMVTRWLLVLIIIGFILRLIAAINLNVFADDMVYASQTAGIFDSQILSTHSNPPLFFYLTDLVCKFFGYTPLFSRIWPLIFGTLLIPLSFLISRKFFDEKIAILSAFLVTFSNFLIRMTYNESSLVILFFSMFGVFLGMEYIEKRKTWLLIFSPVLFGLGCLTKYSAPFFILAFIFFTPLYLKSKQQEIFTKNNFKALLLFIFIILLFCLPFLTFNYLLYKDKGIVDVYFSRVITLESTQQLYSGLLGQDRALSQNLFREQTLYNTLIPFKTDLILSIFAILGIFLLILKKQRIPIYFSLLFLIVPFILQSIGSGLEKHFVFMVFVLSIPAGFGLEYLLSKIKSLNIKKIALMVLILLMFVNLGNQYGTPSDYFSKSETSQIKKFVTDNVNKDDLIVVDPRIYTAKSFWIAADNHVLNMQDFVLFYNQNKQDHIDYGEPTKIYVIECISDDCGWGWVKDNPDFNKTVEDLVYLFKDQSTLEKTISSNSYSGNEFFGEKEKIEVYNIYSLTVKLDRTLVSSVDSYNSFYFAPYLYKDKSGYLFNYNTYNIFDSLLEKLAYYILLLSILLSLISIPLVFNFLKSNNKAF